MGRPNSTESPNIPADTNRRPNADDIEAVVQGYDRMMHRLIEGHATEFTEVGITMTQAKLLYVVMAAGRLRMSELAARLGIGSSSATRAGRPPRRAGPAQSARRPRRSTPGRRHRDG